MIKCILIAYTFNINRLKILRYLINICRQGLRKEFNFSTIDIIIFFSTLLFYNKKRHIATTNTIDKTKI